jgi:hypothetical protein
MPTQKTRTQRPAACTNQEPKQGAGKTKVWGQQQLCTHEYPAARIGTPGRAAAMAKAADRDRTE